MHKKEENKSSKSNSESGQNRENQLSARYQEHNWDKKQSHIHQGSKIKGTAAAHKSARWIPTHAFLQPHLPFTNVPEIVSSSFIPPKRLLITLASVVPAVGEKVKAAAIVTVGTVACGVVVNASSWGAGCSNWESRRWGAVGSNSQAISNVSIC